MKNFYLTLSDGREIRLEWNMNALALFTSVTGKEMTDLREGKADVPLLRTIAWCAAQEGEEADGRQLGLTEIELGRLMSMQCIIKFSEFLAPQNMVTGQKKTSPPNRFPRIFSRMKD